jgi:uncharacterized damage-inducible protein DinB
LGSKPAVLLIAGKPVPVWVEEHLNADDFRRIFSYNRLVLHSFLETLDRLPTELVSKNLEASHGSMKEIFTHILTVYDGWLNHARKGETAGTPDSELDEAFESMDSMKRYMKHVESGVDALLLELTDTMLDSPVKVDWWEKAHSLEDALMQVTIEQAHHLGEIIALLWQHDIEPPEMTWIGSKESK